MSPDPVGPVDPVGPGARELRGQIRQWRRGRADTRLIDAISDAYVALFATVMLGSVAVNVVVGIGRLSDDACTTAACSGARSLLPVLVGVAVLATVVGLARMFGPVFVSPAVGTWLMPTPVDRRGLLRPRLVVGMLAVGALAAVVTAIGTVLGGWSPEVALTWTGAIALVAVGLVSGAVRAQTLLPGPAATTVGVVAWLPVTVLWTGLLVVAAGLASGVGSPDLPGRVEVVVLAVAVGLGLLGIVVGLRSLERLRRRDVSRGGALAPGLSGALASLDLALAYDVVIEHRWRGHLPVRSRRARPGRRVGAGALVQADLVRLRRSPRLLLVPAAAIVVPYAAQAAGAGRVVVLIAPLALFLSGLPLLVGLRVLERTPSLGRMLPLPASYAKGAATIVPGVGFVLLGLASAPVVVAAIGATPGAAVLVGVAVGGSALASAVRWVTGRPPDYGRPLVSTPAGAVPTNLYSSVVRGFDILVLTTAPLLLVDDHVIAAEVSSALSAVVLAALLGRGERRPTR